MYALEFEGAMAGAYVKIRSTPVGVTLKLRGGGDTAELIDLLAQYVIEWNLDGPDGELLPITAEAISEGLEGPVISAILVEWYRAAVGLTAPLDPPGADGTMTDADIPMD